MARNNEGKLKLTVKLNLYPLEAIYNACYEFIGDYYIFLDSRKKGEVEISLKSKKKSGRHKEKLKNEFMNELLYGSTRIAVAKRNKKLREFIVGRALFSAAEDQAEMEAAECDYLKDPLGIAIPWEEKYRQDNKKNKN